MGYQPVRELTEEDFTWKDTFVIFPRITVFGKVIFLRRCKRRYSALRLKVSYSDTPGVIYRIFIICDSIYATPDEATYIELSGETPAVIAARANCTRDKMSQQFESMKIKI